MQVGAFDRGLLFAKSDLIPVVIQHVKTGEVLMIGYTNAEALEKTLETRTAWFYSRSRKRLWNKGETSGNFLRVKEIAVDCDHDALLFKCMPDGPTCHTGEVSCFHNMIWRNLGGQRNDRHD
jgi:phosphoribosyl-AMP cyclohydrolase